MKEMLEAYRNMDFFTGLFCLALQLGVSGGIVYGFVQFLIWVANNQ